MDAVNQGEAPWTTIEAIYRRRLVELLAAHAIAASAEDVEHLTRAWWRLRPWPDTVAGLTRLKRRHVIARCPTRRSPAWCTWRSSPGCRGTA